MWNAVFAVPAAQWTVRQSGRSGRCAQALRVDLTEREEIDLLDGSREHGGDDEQRESVARDATAKPAPRTLELDIRSEPACSVIEAEVSLGHFDGLSLHSQHTAIA